MCDVDAGLLVLDTVSGHDRAALPQSEAYVGISRQQRRRHGAGASVGAYRDMRVNANLPPTGLDERRSGISLGTGIAFP